MWSTQRLIVCILVLFELFCVPIHTKKTVVNYEPHSGPKSAQPADSDGDKDKASQYQPPVFGGEKNLEEVLDNPHFRNRKADLGEDPNLWGDALAAYDAMLKFRDNQQKDPNGKSMGIYQPGLFVPWMDMDVSNSFAARRQIPEDNNDNEEGSYRGLEGRQGFGRAAAVPKDDKDQNTTVPTQEKSTKTSTTLSTTTTQPVVQPPPTRPPLRCPTNPTRRPRLLSTTQPPLPAPTPATANTTTSAAPAKKPPGAKDRDLSSRSEQIQQIQSTELEEDPNKLLLPDRLMPKISMNKSVFDNCGSGGEKGKICFGWELGCIQKQKCRMFTSLQNVSEAGQERVRVTLLLLESKMPKSPFIGLSFSSNHLFDAGDYMFYCIDTNKAIPGEEKNVAVYMSQVGKNHQPIMQTSRPALVSSVCMIGGYAAQGVLGCVFDIAKNIEMDDGTVVDLFDVGYFQIISSGYYEKKGGIKDPQFGHIPYNDKNPMAQTVTSERITLKDDLAKPKIILPRSQFLIYFHVWFAAFAFCFLLPSSMIIAKFGREAFNWESKLAWYKMPKWLLVHIRLNIISLLLIAASLIIIAVDTEFTWQSVGYVSKLHSIVGLVGMLFIFPAAGISGCVFNFKNTHSSVDVPKVSTKIMAWMHWLVGNLSYFAGAFCVVTAGKMSRALAPCMVEYFGWMHLVLHLGILWFMAVDTCQLVKKLDGRYMFQRAVLGPMIPWTHGEVPKVKPKEFHQAAVWKMRRRIIVFHFIVSFLCTFAISTLMVLPTVLCREDWEDELFQNHEAEPEESEEQARLLAK